MPGGRKPKLKVADVVEALRQAHGLKTGAAELLAVSWNTIDKYCKKSPAAQEIVDFWRKRRKDRAEYKLDEAIERGENWAIMFTLKNAADRDYHDRVDVTSGGEPLSKYDEQQHDRAVSALADAVREALSGAGPESDGGVDTPK